MTRYLVLAHQTSASPELVAALREIVAGDAAAEFTLVVPATPPGLLVTPAEGQAREIALRKAAEARDALRESGLQLLDARAGAAAPLEAIREELRRRPGQYDALVISTYPAGISKWLRRDVVEEARREFGLPVTHVVARQHRRAAAETPLTAAPGRAAWDLAGLARWRKKPVTGARGEDLGLVDKILYDYVAGSPVWIGVHAGPLGVRTLLLPAERALPDEDHLTVPYAKEKVADQPHIDVGEGFDSETDEHEMCDYFGLPFDADADIRVLHADDELPGSFRYGGTP